jgi:hypothetical protein
MDDRLKFDALYMGATAVTCLIRQEAGFVYKYVRKRARARARALYVGATAVTCLYARKPVLYINT